MTRSAIAGSAITSGRPDGMSASTGLGCEPRVSSAAATISPTWAVRGEHRPLAGLQPAHVQQAGREVGEPVQGLLGGGQQVRAVVVVSRASPARRPLTAALAAASGAR